MLREERSGPVGEHAGAIHPEPAARDFAYGGRRRFEHPLEVALAQPVTACGLPFREVGGLAFHGLEATQPGGLEEAACAFEFQRLGAVLGQGADRVARGAESVQHHAGTRLALDGEDPDPAGREVHSADAGRESPLPNVPVQS